MQQKIKRTMIEPINIKKMQAFPYFVCRQIAWQQMASLQIKSVTAQDRYTDKEHLNHLLHENYEKLVECIKQHQTVLRWASTSSPMTNQVSDIALKISMLKWQKAGRRTDDWLGRRVLQWTPQTVRRRSDAHRPCVRRAPSVSWNEKDLKAMAWSRSKETPVLEEYYL